MLLFESFYGIEAICKEYGIKNYTINSDRTIDVNGDVHLHTKGYLRRIPLKFGRVDGNFDCSFNRLTTLEGAPKSIGGSFYCSYNQLTTLEGAPQSVGRDFNCSHNELTTLKGAPKSVPYRFVCGDNPLDSVRILFPDSNDFLELYNEWEFFAYGNKIWKHRFLEAMLDIGKELPESIPDYEYI